MKLGWILFSALIVLTGCGYGAKEGEPGSGGKNSARILPESPSYEFLIQDFSGDNYRVTHSFTIEFVNGLVGDLENVSPEKMSFSPGDELIILERQFVPGVGNYVRLGIEKNSEADLETIQSEVNDIWVQERNLPMGNLEQFFPIEEEEFADGGDWEQARKRMTYCYRYVKKYLLSIGQVKTYLPGTSAYQAYWILPKHGFVKTGNMPTSAANGEVCVYSGGPQGHGHIEVKRNGKWWYGYGFKDNPISKRKFMGCFKKA